MNNTPDKLNSMSLDISSENRTRLKSLFPSIFTETFNDKGELVESVDFEKLKAELGIFTDVFENRRERYGMDWPGKKDVLRLIQTPSYATLKPEREDSVNFDTTENVFIEGDNLEVLKLLQKSYYGKVKMIYIDPPYNTGKEFIYPDDYSESLETYLKYAGLIDGNGRKFATNTANEGRFHTKWLNMMYPRLYLAWNLLRDDGVIFVSIADEEVKNLRVLLDEIFGEENFAATITWKKKTNGNNMGLIPPVHDYIMCYGKNLAEVNEDEFGYRLSEEQIRSNYSNPDNDARGLWNTMDLSANHKGPYYGIINPNTGEEFYPPSGRYWVFNQEEVNKRISNGRIIFGRKGLTAPVQKVFLSERKLKRQKPETWWDKQGFNEDGTSELTSLFDKPKIFNHSKPSKLIENIVDISTEDNDIILDFFAGSATTAQAVLSLNKQGGNRRFIMIQLPEPCVEDSEAFKAGYKNIAEIGKERIRRVIKKLNEENSEKLDLDNYTTQDRGFKVLKLDKSNFKEWQKLAPDAKLEEIVSQLELNINHIDQKATQEDLLYEILIKAGFTLTEKIETKAMAGKRVFSIAEGELLICLEDEITNELVNAVVDAEPREFICLDSAFNSNDQLKVNAVQAFNVLNKGKEKRSHIVFKTV